MRETNYSLQNLIADLDEKRIKSNIPATTNKKYLVDLKTDLMGFNSAAFRENFIYLKQKLKNFDTAQLSRKRLCIELIQFIEKVAETALPTTLDKNSLAFVNTVYLPSILLCQAYLKHQLKNAEDNQAFLPSEIKFKIIETAECSDDFIAPKIEAYINKLQALITTSNSLAHEPDDERALSSPPPLPREASGNTSEDLLTSTNNAFPLVGVKEPIVGKNDSFTSQDFIGKIRLQNIDLQIFRRVGRIFVTEDLNLSELKPEEKKSLNGLDFSGFIFMGKVDATGCNLSNSNFSDCEFRGDFIVNGANLSGTKFEDIKFLADYQSDTKTNFGKGKKTALLSESTKYELVIIDPIPEKETRYLMEKKKEAEAKNKKVKYKKCLFVKRNEGEVNNLEYATADMADNAFITPEAFNHNLLPDLKSEKNKENTLNRILKVTNARKHTKSRHLNQITRVFPIEKTKETFAITMLIFAQKQKSFCHGNTLVLATDNPEEAKEMWDDIHSAFNEQKKFWRSPGQFFSDLWNKNIYDRILSEVKKKENKGKEISYQERINFFISHAQKYPNGRATRALYNVVKKYQDGVFNTAAKTQIISEIDLNNNPETAAKTQIISEIDLNNNPEFAQSVRAFRNNAKPTMSSASVDSTQHPAIKEAAPETPVITEVDAAVITENTRVILEVLSTFMKIPSTSTMSSLNKLKACIDKLKSIGNNPTFHTHPELAGITYDETLTAITKKYKEICLKLAGFLNPTVIEEAKQYAKNSMPLSTRVFYIDLCEFNKLYSQSNLPAEAKNSIFSSCQAIEADASDDTITMTRALWTLFSSDKTAQEKNAALVHLKENIEKNFYALPEFKTDLVFLKLFSNEFSGKLTNDLYKKIYRQAYAVSILEDKLTECLTQQSSYDHVKILPTSADKKEFRVQANFPPKFLNAPKTDDELNAEKEKVTIMDNFLNVIQTQIQAMHTDAEKVFDAIAEIKKALTPIKREMENKCGNVVLSKIFDYSYETEMLRKIKTIEEGMQHWQEDVSKMISLPVSNVEADHAETHQPVFS
ncbi:MAG: hypothetical protein A3E82_03720 [Gammaproteobacteria bacterium RIFCSPHIGHO2_12_FULL_38_11]|nr:MAG: hypothetical protein A3E82_03720 [Gammaproteobacteria bacterium RIFCSPHIGHO2_12_FULL_38_11]